MATTPIVNKDTQHQIDKAMVAYAERGKYQEWGLQNLRKMGNVVLLEGPPGSGKTTVAEYMALHGRKKGLKEIDFGKFGSSTPGEGSRQITRLFAEAGENQGMTVFIDEADSILIPRSRIQGNQTWMFEIINTTLAEIAKYKHLVILATNRADALDEALMRRLIARIHVGLPDEDCRARLWKAKWPKGAKYPLKLTVSMAETLAQSSEGLTGAIIERVILNASSEAIMSKREPTMLDMLGECERERSGLVMA